MSDMYSCLCTSVGHLHPWCGIHVIPSVPNPNVDIMQACVRWRIVDNDGCGKLTFERQDER